MTTLPTSPTTTLVSHLVTAGRVLDRRLDDVLAEHGLTLDSWRVLAAIVQADGPSMRDISDSLALPPASATRVVDQLVDNGLAYRGVAPDDRRRVILFPTDGGRSLVRSARHVVAAVQHEVERLLEAHGIDPDAATGAAREFLEA